MAYSKINLPSEIRAFLASKQSKSGTPPEVLLFIVGAEYLDRLKSEKQGPRVERRKTRSNRG